MFFFTFMLVLLVASDFLSNTNMKFPTVCHLMPHHVRWVAMMLFYLKNSMTRTSRAVKISSCSSPFLNFHTIDLVFLLQREYVGSFCCSTCFRFRYVNLILDLKLMIAKVSPYVAFRTHYFHCYNCLNEETGY